MMTLRGHLLLAFLNQPSQHKASCVQVEEDVVAALPYSAKGKHTQQDWYVL